MANMLESSQTQTSTAPGFYTDYLSNIASGAKSAIDPTTGAQYVGAQPLQEKAFQGVEAAGSAYQPTLQAAGTTLGAAAGTASPLSAAQPYLDTAGGNVGTAATGLMSPYTANVVNALGEAGQRNIMQNLAPQATAGAVGSGQFGSKRGAEVLGQTIQNANKDIQNQQYQALNTGYNQALQTALAQKQLEGQLGSTAGTLASAGQQNLTQAGAAQGNLAKTNQELGLADINALSTMGGQQQTIAQNKELFPLTNLSTAAGLIRGYNVPTSTETKMNMSPLSAILGAGAGVAGMLTPGTGGVTPLDSLTSAYDKLKARFTNAPDTGGNSNAGTSGSPDISAGPDITNTGSPDITGGSQYSTGNATGGPNDDPSMHPGMEWDPNVEQWVPHSANGGSIRSHADGGTASAWNSSFAPNMSIGGLPSGGMPQYDQSNTYTGYNDTDGNFVKQ